MANSKRSRDRPKSPPFVMMPWELLNSSAFVSLSPSAAKALPYFLGKQGKAYKREKEDFRGVFEFSYAEAKRLGFATRTFSRIIIELVEKGFLIMAGYGGLRGFCKSFNKFELSDRWRKFGQPDFEAIPRYPAEPR